MAAAHIRPMEENAPRQARPAVRTGIPLKLSAETLALPPIRTPVGIGFAYKDKATGEIWTLSGIRSRHNMILVRGDMRDPEEIREHVSADDPADHYEHWAATTKTSAAPCTWPT